MFGNIIIQEVIGFLRQKSSMMFAVTRDLVEPVFDSTIPTACVVFDLDNPEKCVKFLINEQFWDSLNYNERVFLFAHETLHVILSHGIRGNDFLNSLPEEQRSRTLLNQMMDVAINELILDQYMPDIPRSVMPFLENACFIDTMFKEHAKDILRDQNFAYYYMKYLELFGIEKLDESLVTLDDHGFAGELAETLEEVKAKVEESTGQETPDESDIKNEGRGYSLEDGGESEVIDSTYTTPKDKIEIHLNNLLATSFQKGPPSKVKYNWYGHNRRMPSYMSKDLMLPVRSEVRNKRKHKIVAYCDVSGSCADWSDLFLSLIGDIDPDKYEIIPYVFASRVVKANKTKTGYKYKQAGYGTDIHNVLQHYAAEVESTKPDAVIVLTDGEYDDIRNPRHKIHGFEQWTFFMIKWSNNAPSKSKIIPLNK